MNEEKLIQISTTDSRSTVDTGEIGDSLFGEEERELMKAQAMDVIHEKPKGRTREEVTVELN